MSQINPFKGPIVIGEIYLDTWGGRHEIHGYVPDSNKTLVWSARAHFLVKTGKGGGCQLVVLSPGKEREYWKYRISQIREANSLDKLSLISTELIAMQNRIDDLTRQHFASETFHIVQEENS